MAFQLRPDEGMATGIRRIVADELADAIAGLRGADEETRDAVVHDARKRLKKARAALRLVRTDLGATAQRRETDALRDAARRLSGVRDAQVLLETLDKLEQEADGRLPPAAVEGLRASLERRREELHAAELGEGDVLEQVAGELETVRERAGDWPLDDETFAAAGRGLRRIHGRGHRAMEQAFDLDGDDEAWHDWRKRVKDLWYALRILAPIAPGQLKGLVAEADRLADVLGDHNDIAVLGDALDEHGAAVDPGQLALVRAALERRRDQLRLAAVPPGRRLYAESPKRFERRIHAYWRARAVQAQVDALWLDPPVAGRVRELLAAKASAPAADKRRITAQLHDHGFRIADVAKHVSRRRGGFAAEDFDALVERGIIRIGRPPAPGLAAPAQQPAPPTGTQSPAPAPAPEAAPETGGRHSGPPSVGDLVGGVARLTFDTARWARGRLPR